MEQLGSLGEVRKDLISSYLLPWCPEHCNLTPGILMTFSFRKMGLMQKSESKGGQITGRFSPLISEVM